MSISVEGTSVKEVYEKIFDMLKEEEMEKKW
jgi:hypothetical protein